MDARCRERRIAVCVTRRTDIISVDLPIRYVHESEIEMRKDVSLFFSLSLSFFHLPNRVLGKETASHV